MCFIMGCNCIRKYCNRREKCCQDRVKRWKKSQLFIGKGTRKRSKEINKLCAPTQLVRWMHSLCVSRTGFAFLKHVYDTDVARAQ